MRWRGCHMIHFKSIYSLGVGRGQTHIQCKQARLSSDWPEIIYFILSLIFDIHIAQGLGERRALGQAHVNYHI